MNTYELSRAWFDFSFANPELISPNHTAIYFFAIEHCNRMGGKDKFGLPTSMAMDALGIKKHQTYIRYFNELVEWGFIKLIQKSQNQYSANIISLQVALPKNGKALDKAIIKHAAKQTESMRQSNGQSNSPIIKPINNKPINKGKENTSNCPEIPDSSKARPTDKNEVYLFFKEIGLNGHSAAESQKFCDHYTANGWKIGGRTAMKDWQAAARNWASRVKTGEFGQNMSKKPASLVPDPDQFK